MSLVTTAISSRSRRRLHRRSTSAVLPEPTGPPTPRRSTSACLEASRAAAAPVLVVALCMIAPFSSVYVEVVEDAARGLAALEHRGHDQIRAAHHVATGEDFRVRGLEGSLRGGAHAYT